MGRLSSSEVPVNALGSSASDIAAINMLPGPAASAGSVNYFYGRISRDEAESILRRNGCKEGLYLLRENVSIPGNYALSICHQNRLMSSYHSFNMLRSVNLFRFHVCFLCSMFSFLLWYVHIWYWFCLLKLLSMNKIECLEDYSITSFFLTVASQMTIERMLKILAYGNI